MPSFGTTPSNPGPAATRSTPAASGRSTMPQTTSHSSGGRPAASRSTPLSTSKSAMPQITSSSSGARSGYTSSQPHGLSSSTTQGHSSMKQSSSSAPPKPKTGKERAQEIRQAQQEALASLPHRTLFIVLFIRSDPPPANDFHWGFYYHKNAAGGTKYHIRNMGSGWIPDHASTGGVFKSNFLCTLIKIADVPAAKESQLDSAMRAYDNSLSTIPGLTCRVWLFTVMALLVQYGVVRCNDLNALQTECMSIGNQHRLGAAANNQPRPVAAATLCS